MSGEVGIVEIDLELAASELLEGVGVEMLNRGTGAVLKEKR